MKNDHFTMFKSSNGYWYYMAYRYGQRIKKSTREKTKAKALEVILERIANGDILTDVTKTMTKPKTFREFATGFWNYDTCPIIQDKIQRGGHYSKQSAMTYDSRMEKECIPHFGNKFLPEITNAMIRQWHMSLPKRLGISAKTANDYLIPMRLMFDEAIRQGLIDKNPCTDIKPLLGDAKIRGCYTQKQISQLFSAPWDNILVETACKLAATTGMRLGEVQALSRDQVFEDYIRVDRSYNTKEGIKKTKSGKTRIVPLIPEMKKALDSLPTDGEFYFTTTGDVPMNRKTFEKVLVKRFEVCGIDYKKENLMFHSFRHYFNTRLVASGIEGTKIRSVVGHESEEMTEHYLHLNTGDLDCIRDVQLKILNAV